MWYMHMNHVEKSNWGKDNWTIWIKLWFWRRSRLGQPHNHDLELWGGKCHIFPKPKRARISCGHFLVTKDLLSNDIPLTLYVRIENVIDRKHVFIA